MSTSTENIMKKIMCEITSIECDRCHELYLENEKGCGDYHIMGDSYYTFCSKCNEHISKQIKSVFSRFADGEDINLINGEYHGR